MCFKPDQSEIRSELDASVSRVHPPVKTLTAPSPENYMQIKTAKQVVNKQAGKEVAGR